MDIKEETDQIQDGNHAEASDAGHDSAPKSEPTSETNVGNGSAAQQKKAPSQKRQGRDEPYLRDGKTTNSDDPKLKRARVFVGNLTPEVKRKDLLEVFSQHGEVVGISIHRNYAFVQYVCEEFAEKALAESKVVVCGQQVKIQPAQGETPRSGRGRGGGRPVRRSRSRSPPRASYQERDRDSYRDWDRDRGRDRERDVGHFERDLRRRWEDDQHRHESYERHDNRRSPPRSRDYDEHYRRSPPQEYEYEYERLIRDREARDREAQDREARNREARDHADHRHYDRSRELEHYDATRSSVDYRSRSPERRPLPAREPAPQPPLSQLDCEVLIAHVDTRRYGEMIARKVRDMGMRVEMVLLTPDVTLAGMLEDAVRRHLLYSVLVTEQHELHVSCTVHILEGRMQQEHKNMPIEDAFRLLESDFLRVRSGVPQPSTQVTPLVRQSLSPPRRQPRQLSPTRRQPQRPTSPPVERESRLPSRPHAAEPLSSALSKVVRGGGDDLSADQLSDLIEVLQQKKKAAVGVHSASPVKPREFERATPRTAAAESLAASSSSEYARRGASSAALTQLEAAPRADLSSARWEDVAHEPNRSAARYDTEPRSSQAAVAAQQAAPQHGALPARNAPVSTSSRLPLNPHSGGSLSPRSRPPGTAAPAIPNTSGGRESPITGNPRLGVQGSASLATAARGSGYARAPAPGMAASHGMPGGPVAGSSAYPTPAPASRAAPGYGQMESSARPNASLSNTPAERHPQHPQQQHHPPVYAHQKPSQMQAPLLRSPSLQSYRQQQPQRSQELAPRQPQQPQRSQELAPRQPQQPQRSQELAPRQPQQPQRSQELAPRQAQQPQRVPQHTPSSQQYVAGKNANAGAPAVIAYPGQRSTSGGSGAYSASSGYTEGSAYGRQHQDPPSQPASYYSQQMQQQHPSRSPGNTRMLNSQAGSNQLRNNF